MERLAGIISLLRFLPHWIHNRGVKLFLYSCVNRRPFLKERLSEIEGKIILLEAIDSGKRYYLSIHNGAVVLLSRPCADPHVSIKGDFAVLTGLFFKRLDPDSALFSRKLKIEGDIQTAIYFKNTLANL